MGKVSYLLKTKSGAPFFVFDDISRAKEKIKEWEKKGVHLRLFEQLMIEKELEL